MHRVYIPSANKFGTAVARYAHGISASSPFLMVKADDSGEMFRIPEHSTIPAADAPIPDPYNTGNVVPLCAHLHRPGSIARSPSPGPSAA